MSSVGDFKGNLFHQVCNGIISFLCLTLLWNMGPKNDIFQGWRGKSWGLKGNGGCSEFPEGGDSRDFGKGGEGQLGWNSQRFPGSVQGWAGASLHPQADPNLPHFMGNLKGFGSWQGETSPKSSPISTRVLCWDQGIPGGFAVPVGVWFPKTAWDGPGCWERTLGIGQGKSFQFPKF